MHCVRGGLPEAAPPLKTYERGFRRAVGRVEISMMAGSTNAPCKGRIQMRKTNPLHLLTFGLQRTAVPYSWVIPDRVEPAVIPAMSRYAAESGSKFRTPVF